MIYEVTPQPNILDMLRASHQFEADRDAARTIIKQEIRDRHAAILLLLTQYRHAPTRTAWELLTRTVAKLEAHNDQMFALLEVL